MASSPISGVRPRSVSDSPSAFATLSSFLSGPFAPLHVRRVLAAWSGPTLPFGSYRKSTVRVWRGMFVCHPDRKLHRAPGMHGCGAKTSAESLRLAGGWASQWARRMLAGLWGKAWWGGGVGPPVRKFFGTAARQTAGEQVKIVGKFLVVP